MQKWRKVCEKNNVSYNFSSVSSLLEILVAQPTEYRLLIENLMFKNGSDQKKLLKGTFLKNELQLLKLFSWTFPSPKYGELKHTIHYSTCLLQLYKKKNVQLKLQKWGDANLFAPGMPPWLTDSIASCSKFWWWRHIPRPSRTSSCCRRPPWCGWRCTRWCRPSRG